MDLLMSKFSNYCYVNLGSSFGISNFIILSGQELSLSVESS